jgi:hypothetical protein
MLITITQAKGTAIPSFSSLLLQQYGDNPVEYNTIKWAAGTMFAAGADTVSRFSHQASYSN